MVVAPRLARPHKAEVMLGRRLLLTRYSSCAQCCFARPTVVMFSAGRLIVTPQHVRNINVHILRRVLIITISQSRKVNLIVSMAVCFHFHVHIAKAL